MSEHEAWLEEAVRRLVKAARNAVPQLSNVWTRADLQSAIDFARPSARFDQAADASVGK